MTVTMELREEENFIRVYFPYSASRVASMKKVPGARFNRTDSDDPHWRIPRDIDLCRMMREEFGRDLEYDSVLAKWAKKKIRVHNKMSELALGDTAKLDTLHEKLPELYEAIHLGPAGLMMNTEERLFHLEEMEPSFQAADVKFMAIGDNPMNCNQPGLGKTLEAIAAVYEGDTEHGSKLVIAPKTSLETVWEDHLVKWQDQPVLVAPEDRPGRKEVVETAQVWTQAGEDFWLVINPAMVTYRNAFHKCAEHKRGRAKVADMKVCFDCEPYLEAMFPELLDIPWDVVILDEFHKMGLGNPSTLSYKAMRDIQTEKRIAMSGTPLGGKPIKMYGVLSFLYPKDFTSKWRFADTWLDVKAVFDGHKSIEGIKPGKEDAFYEMLSRYMIRRTKEECLPWLPPKHHIEIEIPMVEGQKEQYEEFAEEAEIRIDEEQLSATSVLSEYTRLKQFASSKQKIVGRDKEGRPILKPTPESNKLPYIIDLLNERGIRPGDEDEGDEQVVIFSQFSSMVDMVCGELVDKGYPAAKITGGVTAKERAKLQRDFQDTGGLRVMCMTTTAGGVAITLDRASTVIFLDETWIPDDQEQAEDRCHRGSRLHQVTVYYLRSKATIEQYIQEMVDDKERVNKDILDLRRKGLRATRKE